MPKQSSGSADNRRDKERVQLDFAPEALERLDELKELIGATTRADTIRQALRLFDWFVRETEPEHMLIIQDDETGEIVTKFRASLLHNETRSKASKNRHENTSTSTLKDSGKVSG